MKNILARINTDIAALQAAQATLAALPALEGMGHTNSFPDGDGNVRLYTYSTDEATLDAFGRAFGKDGWTAKPDGRTYDWHKRVGNIDIKLGGVATVPPLVEYAVQPSEFPILLEA